MFDPQWMPDPGRPEFERRTGRTVRMIKRAFDAAQDVNNQVYIVVPMCNMIGPTRQMIEGLFAKKPKNLHIINIVPRRNEYEHSLLYKTAGRKNVKIFFDHFFWECLEEDF